MRFRMGKGQIIAFDAFIEKTLEAMKAELRYYPALKDIGARCTPPQPPACVFRSINRLAAAGRLSKEALLVYNAKNNTQIKKGSADEKTTKNSKIKGRGKTTQK